MEANYQLHGGDREFIKFHSGTGEAWVLVESENDHVTTYQWVSVREDK